LGYFSFPNPRNNQKPELRLLKSKITENLLVIPMSTKKSPVVMLTLSELVRIKSTVEKLPQAFEEENALGQLIYQQYSRFAHFFKKCSIK
jgi:hypothetical protein